MADNVEVREALAEFTDVTGWFTADRDTNDKFGEIKLTPAQIRRLSAAMRLSNAIRYACDLEDGDGR